MVTEDEIRHVAGLMKIKVDDYSGYVEKVNAMISYFDILDSAGVESEEIPFHEISVSSLREDCHVPFDGSLIEHLKHYRGAYVRAPKMSR
ncbi:MAG: hypothetical protein D9C04_01145 [Nitrosopumilus sp. B06]|nr:MAG: hypothetical protein EB828_01570 [Nitrosopumilus sp. D6]RNJ80497.1 MAG: hypothetical protein D9C04_01145 [Nitrosopumilus sp. B06]